MAESTSASARKGDLVQVHILVLPPGARAANLPEATRAVPYEGWVKGYLKETSAEIGGRVHIESMIGRELEGTLVEINPGYDHDFGEPQPDLNQVGPESWRRLRGEGR
jgi:2-amino-4-ketopentanoate thiolase alpha subunit